MEIAKLKVHPILKPAHDAAKTAWQHHEPNAFATLVAVHDLSKLLERREDVAQLVAALMHGAHLITAEVAP